jgi:sugar/nucleoside kinase (ribokinase family)
MKLTETKDLSHANEKILHYGVKLSLITSGAGGVLARTRRFELQQPVFKIDPIDPTGAGDAFCAGILSGLIERFKTRERVDVEALSPKDVREIVLLGQAVGAICCTGVGSTEAVSWEAVSQLIEDQGEHVRNSTQITVQRS